MGYEAKPGRPRQRGEQLYRFLRDAILQGRLAAGVRMPSTRDMAATHGVARGTVVGVFEQLIAEGMLQAIRGSGTYVARLVAGSASPANSNPVAAVPAVAPVLAVNPFAGRGPGDPLAMRPNMPALDRFPHAVWARCVREALEMLSSRSSEGDAQGDPSLRTAITLHLALSRGVRCDPDQIVIFSSVQQALDLASRLLTQPGDEVVCEDPGYPAARQLLVANRLRLQALPVDDEGMVVDELAGCRARLAYVTPAHHAPLGVSLAPERRRTLIEWAHARDAWIFEDDYDGEFHYEGHTLSAMRALPGAEDRVLLAGTFSKTMLPWFRVAYLVVPASLVAWFVSAKSLTSRYQPLLDQLALGLFIEQGHLARHLTRTRSLYGQRRQHWLDALRDLAPQVRPVSPRCGLDALCWLPASVQEDQVATAMRAAGFAPWTLGRYTVHRPLPPALLFGFACATERQHREAAGALKEILSR